MPTTYRPTHLLVVEDASGTVNLAALQHPEARLHYYTQQGLTIQRHRIVRAAASLAIYDALRRRFQLAATVPAAARPISSAWYLLEFDAIVDAILEYDPTTGERGRRELLAVGDQVNVTGFGAGKVTGFSACGRIAVAIDRITHAALNVLAPASQVEALT